MLYDTKEAKVDLAFEVMKDLVKNAKSPENKKRLVDYANRNPVDKYYKLFSQLAKFSDEELMEMEDEYYKKITNRKLNEKEKVRYELKYVEKSLEQRFLDKYSDIDLENLQILSNMESNLNNENLTIKDTDRMKRTLVSLETEYDLAVSFLSTFEDMYYDKLTNKFIDSIKKQKKLENEVSYIVEENSDENKKGRGMSK